MVVGVDPATQPTGIEMKRKELTFRLRHLLYIMYSNRKKPFDLHCQTSNWCLACFFNRQLVNRRQDQFTMLTRVFSVAMPWTRFTE